MNRRILVDLFHELNESYKNDNNIGVLITTNMRANSIIGSEINAYYANNFNIDYRITLLFKVCELMLIKHTLKIYRLEGRRNLESTYNFYKELRRYILDGINYGYPRGDFNTVFE